MQGPTVLWPRSPLLPGPTPSPGLQALATPASCQVFPPPDFLPRRSLAAEPGALLPVFPAGRSSVPQHFLLSVHDPIYKQVFL